jgi:hypothetical protein
MHLSPAALDAAIRLLDAPESASLVETAPKSERKVNA